MRRLLLAVLAGAVGAAVLHIVIVFLVPYFAVGDAWSKLSEMETSDRFRPLPSTPGGKEGENPFMRTRVCRFVIASAPLRLSADGRVPFWSLGVFDRHSNELFSINDRTAEGGRLDIALALPAQMVRLRQDLPEVLGRSVLVEIPAAEGYVLLRTVVPDDSWDSTAEAFLDAARCRPLDRLGISSP